MLSVADITSQIIGLDSLDLLPVSADIIGMPVGVVLLFILLQNPVMYRQKVSLPQVCSDGDPLYPNSITSVPNKDKYRA